MAKQNANANKSTKKTKKPPSALAKGYLFLYNFIQTLGLSTFNDEESRRNARLAEWSDARSYTSTSTPLDVSHQNMHSAYLSVMWSYLLYQIITYYIVPSNDNKNLYETVKYSVIIFQNAAVLEILHAATGLVPSNVLITTFQVLSRVMLVCGVLIPTPTAKISAGVPLALLAWSVTEIIRYGYYTLNLVNAVPYFLIYLRYTTFIALYPIGVTGELLCLYAAQEYVGRTQMWSISMPNPYNFAFSYHYHLLVTMAAYVPIFPYMYMHMFSQRKKMLTPSTPKKEKVK